MLAEIYNLFTAYSLPAIAVEPIFSGAIFA